MKHLLNVCAVLKQVLMNSSEINTLKALKNLYSSTVLKFIFFHMTDFCIFCFDCFFSHWVEMGVAPLGKA